MKMKVVGYLVTNGAIGAEMEVEATSVAEALEIAREKLVYVDPLLGNLLTLEVVP